MLKPDIESCDAMPQGRIKLATRVIGSSVAIEVCDNGVRIPVGTDQDIRPFTTKEMSGHGPWPLRAASRKHRGVQVESERGVGTTFRVLLPIADNYYQGTGKQAEKPTARVKARA